MKHKTLLFAFLLTACATPTPLAPLPTYTPYPTWTPAPTQTARIEIITATQPPATDTPAGPTNTPAPTVDQSAVATARAEAMQKQAKSDGFYLIGIDIAPGVWRSNGSGSSCYWSVTTATGDIINNHFGQAGGTVFLPADGFQVQFRDCGAWEFLQ